MTDVGEFIDDFLQHEYDPVKAREYYLRTRKLVGRKTKQAKQIVDNAYETDKEAYEKQWQKNISRIRSNSLKIAQTRAAREERLVVQQRRLEQARAKVKKVKDPKKRSAAEKKLDALEGRLKKALNKVKPKNPLAGIKVSKAKPRPAADFKPKVSGAPRLSRTKAAEVRSNRVREQVKNLPAQKRRDAEKKLNELDKRLKATARRPKVSKANPRSAGDFKLRNPFAGAKISRD